METLKSLTEVQAISVCPVGLIAGRGSLPALLLEALKSENIPAYLLAVQGEADPGLTQEIPHLWIGLGEVAKALDFLRTNGVSRVVMAGGIRRPALKSLKVDWKGALWIAQLGVRGALGDDTLLCFLAEKLNAEGFQVLAPQDVLKPLLGEVGLLTEVAPSSEALRDVALGLRALGILSPLDMGQAVVVQEGILLGAEGVEGTDGLIERCAPFQKGRKGAIMVKGAKVGQDLRFDLPTIGPETVKKAIQAGFQGVAFEAHRTLVLYPEKIKELTREAGFFVMGAERIEHG